MKTDKLITNIRTEMDREGINQKQLAKRCGLTEHAVGELLRGNTQDILVSSLYKIAKALNCKIKKLI